MAFPAVADNANSVTTATAASITADLPSYSAGDVVVLLVHTAAAGAISTPSGWSVLIAEHHPAVSSGDRVAAFMKTMDGSEGTTVVISSGGTPKWTVIAYTITGADDIATTPPEVTSEATGTSANPNAPSLAPSGGADDYLWIVFGGQEGNANVTGSVPSYTNTNCDTGTGGSAASNPRTMAGYKQANAVSDDPGSWTMSASEDWFAYTIAFYPAPAGGTSVTATVNKLTLSETLNGVTVTGDAGITANKLTLSETLRGVTVVADGSVTVGKHSFAETLRSVTVGIGPDVPVAKQTLAITQRGVTVVGDSLVVAGKPVLTLTLRGVTVSTGSGAVDVTAIVNKITETLTLNAVSVTGDAGVPVNKLTETMTLRSVTVSADGSVAVGKFTDSLTLHSVTVAIDIAAAVNKIAETITLRSVTVTGTAAVTLAKQALALALNGVVVDIQDPGITVQVGKFGLEITQYRATTKVVRNINGMHVVEQDARRL